jgi:hypothetical protein
MRYGASTQIRHLLLQNQGLLAKTRLLLIDKLSEALMADMCDAPGLSPARIAQMISDHAERAVIFYAAHADEQDLPQIAEALIEAGRMNAAFLLRAICMGNIALFANSVAELCEIPARRVEAAMEAGRRPAFRALYLKAGLPDSAFEVFADAIDAWRKVLAGPEIADSARLTWMVTREVLSNYRGKPGNAADGLLVLLRRLAAEAARMNARSHAGRIALEMREREQQLLEMHAENCRSAALEEFPVIDLPQTVLLEFAIHLADEIVALEEADASEASRASLTMAQQQAQDAAANDDFLKENRWGAHPLHVDFGDAVARPRAA